jgi:hypothetical protein
MSRAFNAKHKFFNLRDGFLGLFDNALLRAPDVFAILLAMVLLLVAFVVSFLWVMRDF